MALLPRNGTRLWRACTSWEGGAVLIEAGTLPGHLSTNRRTGEQQKKPMDAEKRELYRPISR